MSVIPPVACLGVSHRTASLALRERLAFGPEAQADFYARVRREQRAHAAPELLLLSTCNRTELYVGPVRQLEPVRDGLLELLATDRGVARASLERAAYTCTGRDVVRHLARVAAGADSMVFGEAEILGQVRTALQVARTAGAAGAFMTGLVEHAVRAGRRARAETEIGHHPGSVASEAVRAVGEVVALDGAQVVLVGAGAMARAAGQLFRKRGSRPPRVVTRTTRHGARLARELGGESLPWHDLARAVAEADVVLTATTAPHALVTVELVRATRRHGRILAVVDISVPRNVEPGVGRLPAVRLLDLDELQHRVEANLEARRRALPQVERIIEEETDHFAEWEISQAVRPVLTAMHARGDAIRREELDRLFARLGGELAPETREVLEHFSRALVNKLLHEPSRSLRQDADNVSAVRRLFGLSDVA